MVKVDWFPIPSICCFCVNVLCPLLGFSALHEDIDSPRPGRRTEATCRSPGSGQEVPMVAAEDLSTSLSSLHETMGRAETDSKASGLLRTAQKEKLQKEMETT